MSVAKETHVNKLKESAKLSGKELIGDISPAIKKIITKIKE